MPLSPIFRSTLLVFLTLTSLGCALDPTMGLYTPIRGFNFPDSPNPQLKDRVMPFVPELAAFLRCPIEEIEYELWGARVIYFYPKVDCPSRGIEQLECAGDSGHWGCKDSEGNFQNTVDNKYFDKK